MIGIVDAALAHEKYAVAQLIARFEDTRPDAVADRVAVIAALRARAVPPAVCIGMTGSPGSGKSTLLGRVALGLVAAQPTTSVAVVAVDPSSRVSGGALLGDRTRTHFPPSDRRLFFRSQAAAAELGGLAPSTFQVCRLLSCLYDYLFVETVGIGQSEGDIGELADHVLLVLQPLGGDEIQFLKAGIMEVPDAFVVNKCDEPAALQSYHQLRGSLGLARPFEDRPLPIFQTSGRTGAGIDALVAHIANVAALPRSEFSAKEPYFFVRWVRQEWGRIGVQLLDEQLGGAAQLIAARGYDEAQAAFATQMKR